MILDGCKNSLGDRPTICIDALQKCSVAQSDKFSPLCNVERPSMNNYHMISSGIIRLFLSGRPFYVAWFIIAIVINSFNRMKNRWSWSDMLIKCHKIILPFITKNYAPATIVVKTVVIWIITSLFYAFPRFVFRSIGHAMCRTSKPKFSTNFYMKTPAGFCVSRFDRACFNYSRVSTITNAFPSNRFAIFNTLNNSKAIKGLSCKINKWWHNNNLLAKIFDERSSGRLASISSFLGSSPLAA